jgi:two-component system cell cycle response regulator
MHNAGQQRGVNIKEHPQELEKYRLAIDFFDQTLNGIQDSLLVINPRNYKIETFNQSALYNLELSEDYLLNISCHKLFHGQIAPCQLPFQACPVRQVMNTKTPLLAEYQYITPKKQLKHFEVSVNFIPDKKNNRHRIAYMLRDITARKTKNSNVAAASYRDQLTNLYNQTVFKRQLAEELSRAKRYQRPLSLLVIGIDDLAAFDTLSLAEKSDFLRLAGEIINNNIREIDSGYNCGANRFQIILPETDKTEALAFAERLRKIFKTRILKMPLRSMSVFTRLTSFTISMGIAGLKPGDNAETLTVNALSALQNAKRAGGDRIYSHSLEGAP